MKDSRLKEITDFTSYQIAYLILEKDFSDLLEYVYPADVNLKTFSHRTYELLLRCATEFENISKQKLLLDGVVSPNNIHDYQKLNEYYHLSKTHVEFIQWEFQKSFHPFEEWKNNGNSSLGWYKSYNAVKHNRKEKFYEANFENVILALSALTLLSYKVFGEKFFEGKGRTSQGFDLPGGGSATRIISITKYFSLVVCH